MTNPFKDNSAAFDPMFTDMLSAVCARESAVREAEIKCCIFPIEDIDPFDANEVDSAIKKVNVLIRHEDWNTSSLSDIVPEIGDRITSGVSYKICNVEDENGQWRLEGRSV